MDLGARIAKIGTSSLALATATLGLGCPAFNQQNRDVDRTPITNIGTGASILYPGQSPPVYQGAQHPRLTGQGTYGAPPAQGSSPQPGSAVPGSAPAGAQTVAPGTSEQRNVSGAPPPRAGSGITLLGGVTTEAEYHVSVDEKPVWFKYVMLPVAIVAAPFKYAIDAATPEPETGPEIPTLENGPARPPRAPPPSDSSARSHDYETRTIEQLERELDQRAPTSRTTSPPNGSFAAELARLRNHAQNSREAPQRNGAQNSREAPQRNGAQSSREAAQPRQVAARPPPPIEAAPQRAAPATSPPATSRMDPALAGASGHVDRDGDGSTDHWIFRERGEIVRELLDDDFDGRPDRTLHYDLATHQIDGIEEDGNGDGHVDTWTSLRDGSIVRRRSDADGDGHVDTWSFFQEGSISRLERDSDGDGFRDRVTRYEDGRLAREDQDDNADGRVETVRYYDSKEQVSRLEEDTDRDGQIDMITHYNDGRLQRREILDPSVMVPAPSISEHN